MQIRLLGLNIAQLCLDALPKDVTYKNIFLGELGKYEIIGDKIVLFKQNTAKPQKIPCYVDDMTALVQRTPWLRARNGNHLPTAHFLVNLRTISYKVTKRLRLCVEYASENSTIVDWYFATNEQQTSLEHAKNDMHSFIGKAKKS